MTRRSAAPVESEYDRLLADIRQLSDRAPGRDGQTYLMSLTRAAEGWREMGTPVTEHLLDLRQSLHRQRPPVYLRLRPDRLTGR